MKLLIITQKVDKKDGNLGFFHAWIREFAGRCEQVIVLCLEQGSYDFPRNVRVVSLGKEKNGSRLQYLSRFYRFVWRDRKNYDAVFVHMNPEYVVLGGLLWKAFHKRIALWYTHKSVTNALRVAEKFSDVVFTASKESFRLKSEKTRIVGHGIDTDIFYPTGHFPQDKLVVSAGRISSTKQQFEIVRLFEKVLKKVPDAQLLFIGDPILEEDKAYYAQVRAYVQERGFAGSVAFHGSVPHEFLPDMYRKARIAVNMSKTGSLDKVVLEALACNVPALTTNRAFEGVIPKELIVSNEDTMADMIATFLLRGAAGAYRDSIIRDHSLNRLIKILIAELNGVMKEDEVRRAYAGIVGEKFHGDYEYHRWFQDPISRADHAATLKVISLHLFSHPLSFKNYLELGPGAGTWTQYFIEKAPRAAFDAVDISKEMIALAKKRFEGVHAIRFFESNFLEFSPDKKYDFFFSSRVIEYIPDTEAVVRKIASLLESGGRGFVITKTPKHIRNKLLGRKPSALHKGQIASWQLKEVFEKSGFRDVALYPVTVHIPFFRSALLNRAAHTLMYGRRLTVSSQLVTESYCVIFSKP